MKSGSISFQFIGTETVYSDFPLKNSQNLTVNGVCGEIINFVRIQRTSCMLWRRMPFLLSRKSNGTKALVLQACKSLNAVCEAKQSTQEEMNRLASLLPEYEVVMQMEGTGPITGPALMAEIGDVRRFKNKKALVAFAGIDAPPFQSGNFESKSRHVSKRGSPHLRRTVFLVANIILTLSHKDNSVFCFMDKKRAEGKHYYVYTIAGSAKFLRIYYARVTEYLRTQEIPVAASCLNGNS